MPKDASSVPDLSGEARVVLAELNVICKEEKDRFAIEIAYPEQGPVLDLASRIGDDKRTFRHIYQNCLSHTEHFKNSMGMRLVYTIDCYLGMFEQRNPIGIFDAARSALETYALCSYVGDELNMICQDHVNGWKERGLTFFETLVRARWGSTDPKLQAQLRDLLGPSCPSISAFKQSQCRKALAKKLDWVDSHYAMLCDYVHPNLSGQRATVHRSRIGRAVTLPWGQILVVPNDTPFISYKYPSPRLGIEATEMTISRFLECVKGTSDALHGCPASPYTKEEVAELSGTKWGFEVVPQESSQKRGKIGRNEKCFCGSGKKYKHCCGRAGN